MTTLEEQRALVGNLFPELGTRMFAPIGDGWTVHTYEVDDGWIVQLPRSEYAEGRLLGQIDALPKLARELSARIPVPEHVSLDPPAMAYRKLDGTTLNRASDGHWPERLGRFLYDLHMVLPEVIGLRSRTVTAVREELATALATVRTRVFPLLEADERDRYGGRFDAFMEDESNWRFATCLTHGDIGPEHVLVSDTGDLVGVLDWEDLSVGDPVSDFAWLLSSRPAEGERALGVYGGAPDASFRTRAAFAFFLMPFDEVLYGLDEGGERFIASGIAGVRSRAQPPY
jgi:macrolide phosphotransferase